MTIRHATGMAAGYMVDTNKVCTSLSYRNRWPQTCCKPIKFVRNGVGYCGIHDPVHQLEMQRKREQKRSESAPLSDRSL